MNQNNQMSRTQRQAYALAILRIVVVFLFIQHVSAKFLEFPISMTDGHGSIELFTMMGLAGILELVAGSLLLLGFFGRVAAFVLSGEMAVAYLVYHVFSWSSVTTLLTPLANQGESAVLFCFIFLYISVVGTGAWSINNK